MRDHLAEVIRRYVAVTSVGASTVRGSPSGTADAARDALFSIQLARLGISDERVFRSRLNQLTEGLRRALPVGRRHWGLARKIVNIYLRNAFYNHYLRKTYHLDRSELLLEVPVDSAVAKGLRRSAATNELPRWPGLRSLKPAQHEEYQKYAIELAMLKKMSRVHLDALLWVQER